MQKNLFVFALMTCAAVGIAFVQPISAITDIRLGTILTILITLSFYVFSAILVMKSRVRNWKSIGLLFLYSLAYFYLLIIRIFYIPNLSEYFLPACIGLISLILLTAEIYILRNKEKLPDLLEHKKK